MDATWTDSHDPYAASRKAARTAQNAHPVVFDERSTTHPVLFGYVAWILGIFGAHRFYYGKPISGLIYLLTGGLLGIGWIIDLFLIPQMAIEADRRYRSGDIDYTIAWLALTFLGPFGVHRFYMGKFVSGIVYLFTVGLFGLGIIYDVGTLNEQIDETNRRSAG